MINHADGLVSQGDAPILSAAQLQIRNEFRQKASIDASDAPAAIKHAEEVAKVLRQNVVQGRRIEEGKDSYSTLGTDMAIYKHELTGNCRAADT